MSTRSTTHFTYNGDNISTAIVYRHSDGYPEGAGADLLTFVERCRALRDSRLNDPSFLAARYVVFLAQIFHKYGDSPDPLDFLSVGVVNADPGDIEYRYVVVCGRDPVVRCFTVCNDATEATEIDLKAAIASATR